VQHPIDQRIVDLIRAMDATLEDIPPHTDGMDVNEIFGVYDGKLLVIREMWQELKTLLGIFGEDDSPGQN
jgi:hypothetical protein